MKFLLIILSIIYLLSPTFAKSVDYNSKYNRLNDDKQQNINSSAAMTYIKASIPSKIFQCMTKFNIFRCMKLFILQRMDSNRNVPVTGNVTNDFLKTILYNNNDKIYHISDSYLQLSETELNTRLHESFQKFFKDREIKMHFIPGMMVKVVPSKSNLIDLSLSKNSEMSVSRGKNKFGGYMMKLGLPAMMLPMALLGSFLPMMLPALKMATLFTGMMNNTALIAALMYLARTAALEHEQKNTIYYTSGATQHHH